MYNVRHILLMTSFNRMFILQLLKIFFALIGLYFFVLLEK